MKSRRRRRPANGCNDNVSVGSSMNILQRRHRSVHEYSNDFIVESENDAFLVHGISKTPKTSNRAKPYSEHPRSQHAGKHDCSTSVGISRVELCMDPITEVECRIIPSVSVEAMDSTNSEEQETMQSQSACTNFRPLDVTRSLTNEAIHHYHNTAAANQKSPEVSPLVESAVKHRLQVVGSDPRPAKRQASIHKVREPISDPAHNEHKRSPDAGDFMDCSSGESLGFERSILLSSFRNENSSFTSSKLEKIRRSEVDNPKVISAMLSSRQSPPKCRRFPVGSTIGGEELDDCESLGASEITMRTMEELGMLSETIVCDSGLTRSRSYPSNLCKSRYFDPFYPKGAKMSAFTPAAGSRSQDVLKAPRPILAVDASLYKNVRCTASFEDMPCAMICPETLSPPSVDSPHTSLSKQGAVFSKLAPTIIRIDQLPKPPLANILFEYQGEMFQHAPLPSGWDVRMSKSKNRPYYIHPERGATWHCPVVNPIGAVQNDSPICSKLGPSSTNSRHEDTDDYDSLTSDESSTISFGSTDGFSFEKPENPVKDIGEKPIDQRLPETMTKPNMFGEVPLNVVMRAVTTETGDLNAYLSDSTIEAQVCRAAEHLVDDAASLETVSNRCESPDSKDSVSCDDSAVSFRRDAIKLNMTSPDEEIVSLVLVNLSQRRVHKDLETVILYDCDRLDSPSKLETQTDLRESVKDTSIPSMAEEATCMPVNDAETCKPPDCSLERFVVAPSLNDDAGTFELRRAQANSMTDEVATANEDEKSSKNAEHGKLSVEEESFSDDIDCLPDGDCAVQMHVDENPLKQCGHGEHRQQLLISEYEPHGETERGFELTRSNDNGSFIGDNDASETSQRQSESDQSSVQVHEIVTDLCAPSDFHTEVIGNNSLCSISTIGGDFQRESCADETHWTTMSMRVVNPPHPICALQHLDRLASIARTLGNIQSNRPPTARASFVSDTARRLSFLHCR